MSSFLEQLAQAYMAKERNRLGIPEQERAAAMEARRVSMAPLEEERARLNTELLKGRVQAMPEEAAALKSRRESENLLNQARAEELKAHAEERARGKSPTSHMKPMLDGEGNIVAFYNDVTGEITDVSQAGLRTKARPQPRMPNITIVNTPEGMARINKQTGEVLPIKAPSGEGQLQPGPTADMRNREKARQLVSGSIDAVDALSKRIITKIGPMQRLTSMGRSAEAVLGSDPEFRTYQDARMALAGNLAVAQQGSRPSDADIRAIWLPLVPDAFRDTSESAKMKWDMIRRMSHVGGETQTPAAPPSSGFRVLGVRPK